MKSINSTAAMATVAQDLRAGAVEAPNGTPVAMPANGNVVVSTVAEHGDSQPVKNLRITFWGVQGSCPLFPEPHEVENYKHHICLYTVEHIFKDIKAHSTKGYVRIEDLLGGPITPSSILAYQEKIGTPDLPVYGGETTCVAIETSDGHTIIIDGGSGIRNGSKHMIPAWGERPREVHILGTHEHLDHRSGLPFCQFCFTRPPFALNIYGTQQFLNALDSRYGIFSHEITEQMNFDDPVDYRIMSASFRATELRSFDENDKPAAIDPPWRIHDIRKPIFIGKTKVTAFDVYHGVTRCLSYKIEHNGVTFLFSTDHEVRHGGKPDDPRQAKSLAAEARLRQHSQDADLAYYDGQYRLEEYLGRARIGAAAAVSRMDWGHGCIEDIIERATQCRVKKAFIGHHDPERSWQDRLKIDQDLHELKLKTRFELAKSELVLHL